MIIVSAVFDKHITAVHPTATAHGAGRLCVAAEQQQARGLRSDPSPRPAVLVVVRGPGGPLWEGLDPLLEGEQQRRSRGAGVLDLEV